MYRTLPNGVGMEYFEATIVRLYADETSYKVIMGYRPIDDIVAEEKKHRQELENEMATLRNIHEALGSGAWKLQYNEQGEMTTCQWSDTMRHMLGFTSTEDFSDEFESWMNRLHPDADECNSWILTVDEEKTSGCGTPPGGTIRIDTRELPCDRDGYINIETVVTDTGIGMSEEFLPHLFDSFSRERDTTMAKVAGSGLGMAIVKSLVDLMGGTIAVESEPGKGTRFSVTVPHKIADEEYYEKKMLSKALEQVDFTGKHILLAEDNELNAEIAVAILEEMGFVVDHVEDGVLCVDKLEREPAGTYDLILMDIQMPNMDGYKAAQIIRSLPDKEKANIPIFAMTANAFAEDRIKALEMGMNGHIAKPIDGMKIKEVLLPISR